MTHLPVARHRVRDPSKSDDVLHRMTSRGMASCMVPYRYHSAGHHVCTRDREAGGEVGDEAQATCLGLPPKMTFGEVASSRRDKVGARAEAAYLGLPPKNSAKGVASSGSITSKVVDMRTGDITLDSGGGSCSVGSRDSTRLPRDDCAEATSKEPNRSPSLGVEVGVVPLSTGASTI